MMQLLSLLLRQSKSRWIEKKTHRARELGVLNLGGRARSFFRVYKSCHKRVDRLGCCIPRDAIIGDSMRQGEREKLSCTDFVEQL